MLHQFIGTVGKFAGVTDPTIISTATSITLAGIMLGIFGSVITLAYALVVGSFARG